MSICMALSPIRRVNSKFYWVPLDYACDFLIPNFDLIPERYRSALLKCMAEVISTQPIFDERHFFSAFSLYEVRCLMAVQKQCTNELARESRSRWLKGRKSP